MRVLRHEEIYDCLVDDEAFSDLPGMLAEAVDARSTTVHWRYQDNTADVLAHSRYFTDEQITDYAVNFAAQDVWALSALTPRTLNRVWAVDDLVPVSRLRDSAFYNDWIRQMGDDTFHCIGIGVSGVAGEGVIGVHRGKGQGAFGQEHVKAMETYMPHLRRLMRVRGQMAAARQTRRHLGGILDAIALATLSVTREGRLVHANAAGEALLRRGDLLVLRQGRLRARNAAAGRHLDRAIGRAACPSAPQADAVAVPTACGGGASITVSPMLSSEGRHVLLLVQEHSLDVSVPARLRSLFGVTRAEADLAVLLSQGARPGEIAEARTVSIGTVRGQIKSLAAKMNCSRQAEIVALVKSLPPLAPGPVAATHAAAVT